MLLGLGLGSGLGLGLLGSNDMNELGTFFDDIRGKASASTERWKNWDLAKPTLPLNYMEWEDAVTIGIRVLCSRWLLTVCLWIISYILGMIQVMCGGIMIFFIFLPLWLGRLKFEHKIFKSLPVFTYQCFPFTSNLLALSDVNEK